MNKLTKILSRVLCLMPLAALGFASCSTVEEEGEFKNWQSRNQEKVDSIANVCAKNAEGNWERICAYNLNDSIENLKKNNNHYIYVQKLEKGSGTYKPLYKDSVRVHYEGRLLPSTSYSTGKVFDKSYSRNTLNEETDVPSLMGVGGKTIVGFSTALMNMVEGDHWLIYIPHYLAYGTDTSAPVPAYSFLIFDVKLAKIYKYGIDLKTDWY